MLDEFKMYFFCSPVGKTRPTYREHRNSWHTESTRAGLFRLTWPWEFRALSLPWWYNYSSFKAQFKCHLHWKTHSDAPRLSCPGLCPYYTQPNLYYTPIIVIICVPFPNWTMSSWKAELFLILTVPPALRQCPKYRRPSVDVELINEWRHERRNG